MFACTHSLSRSQVKVVEHLAECVGYSDPGKLVTAAIFLVSCGADFILEKNKLVNQGISNNDFNEGFNKRSFRGLQQLLRDIMNDRKQSPDKW